MPRQGYNNLTLTKGLVTDLRTEATKRNVTVPKLLNDLLSVSNNIKALEDTINFLNNQISLLQEEKEQLAKIEPKTIEKVVEKPVYLERTIEKEKIVEKVVYKDPCVNLTILCPSKTKEVNINEECLRNCADYVNCPIYFEITVEKKIPQNAKRLDVSQ
jgi:hypothetical protein